MKRRDFVKNSAMAMCAVPALNASGFVPSQTQQQPPAWVNELVKNNDAGITALRPYQVKDSTSKDLGGVRDGFDILNPHSTSGFIQGGACALASPASAYYKSVTLLEEMNLAAAYLVRTQHADGTVDLLATNFHSTPDTGFLVKRLTMSYTLIEQSNTPGKEKLLANLKIFLLKAGEALSVGGIHTPNHRWVVSAALTKLNERWPNPKYTARINQWLGEHIDIDQDGQFNEKSTFIYSSLTDRLLITVGKGMNKPELFDAIRRNLDMTMYYVHPNGEIVTDASGRQDKATIGTLENYYYPYRYFAIKDQNGTYAAMCELIEKTAGKKIGSFLDYYLTDPALWAKLPASKPYPVEYVRTFPNSGLVRIRKTSWDSTLIAKNPVWLTFMNGTAVLQGMRFASSFFGKGQFQTNQIEATDNGWKLVQKLEGPYWQPIAKEAISPDGDWDKMPRITRPQSEVQKLETTVVIKQVENGMEIEISTAGTERVPVAWELIFRPGGTFQGLTKVDGTKDSWLMSGVSADYVTGSDKISFGPGTALHKNIALRGSLPAMDAPSVYLTGFTPFKHKLTLLAVRS
jgi:hypothetical protein